MPAGFSYNLNPQQVDKELARYETAYRFSGGFNLVDDELPQGAIVPQLAPLHVDFKTRKAVVVKGVKLLEALKADATSVKVSKGSFAKVGMFVGDGAKGARVKSINTNDSAFDTITFDAAFGANKPLGDVLFQSEAVDGLVQKRSANALNYAPVKVEPGATVTALGQIYEIKEDRLLIPISSKDKETLTSRFIFV